MKFLDVVMDSPGAQTEIASFLGVEHFPMHGGPRGKPIRKLEVRPIDASFQWLAIGSMIVNYLIAIFWFFY